MSCGLSQQRLLQLAQVVPATLNEDGICQRRYRDKSGNLAICGCDFSEHRDEIDPPEKNLRSQESLKISVVLQLSISSYPAELIPLNENLESAEKQVAEYFRRKVSSTRKKQEFDAFHLTNNKGHRVVVTAAVNSNETYYFSLPRTIIVESASYWKADKVALLGIDIEIDHEFQSNLITQFPTAILPEKIPSLEEESEQLIQSLEHVKFESKLDDEALDLEHLTPVEKALLVMRKYPEVEAAVDIMVTFLMHLCGFYKNRLFAFPQFPFKIQFGEKTADAKPDFTIFDLKTYYRIAVVEDKSQWNSTPDMDVEAQLMAEAIAMAQANRAKSGEHHSQKKQAVGPEIVLGIRVRGTCFTFYLIPVTEAVLQAMNSCVSATVRTKVKKTQSLDLLSEIDRKKIIELLLFYRVIADVTGNGSERRESLSNH